MFYTIIYIFYTLESLLKLISGNRWLCYYGSSLELFEYIIAKNFAHILVFFISGQNWVK